ncbi:alpha/beta hydrolase [Plectonema radiosum NIES-515]|uniref:Alpha/beta hydrolase n=1 Tax=Plectonema radiosum NIES-515 TaxID=2986073 RepID=A0ABT3B4A1_9CYAN|nr:alpha/beta hydrolase [Plectonema radiosum]MCV3216201.1 alpha/beta hydrolase [Plectonema radiosum NIES-515]
MINYLYRLLLCISGCLIFLIFHSFIGSSPSLAAEKIVFRYGIFAQSLPVADIRKYAETKKVSSDLQSFLGYLKPKQQQKFQEALQVKKSLDIVALNKLVDSEIGKLFLFGASRAIARRDRAGVPALRSALLLGAKSSEGLSILSFLESYPSNKLVIDVPATLDLVSKSKSFFTSDDPTPKDNLSSSLFWQLELQYQVYASEGKQFSGCLFGDSISAQIGDTLGEGNFNFGINGLSSISLVQQLQRLIPTKVKCEKTIIAVGGNDAWYQLSDEDFRKKLLEAIALVRTSGTKQIFLIPAFYSTVAASKDPSLAAPLPKVEQINAVINQVAASENVPVVAEGIAPLYENNVLKDNFTTDGDHLNAEGLKIYRQALLNILGK